MLAQVQSGMYVAYLQRKAGYAGLGFHRRLRYNMGSEECHAISL